MNRKATLLVILLVLLTSVIIFIIRCILDEFSWENLWILFFGSIISVVIRFSLSSFFNDDNEDDDNEIN